MGKIAAIAVAFLAYAAWDAHAAENVVDVGSKKQFWFNGQDLVAETTLLRIYQPRPEKYARGPIVVADKPWEGTLVQLYSADVRRDEATGRWQMWYEGHPGMVNLCTAFSND